MEDVMKTSKTRWGVIMVSLLLMLVLIPSGVLAGSKSGEGVTLYYPDSYTSCKPADKITTSGVPGGGKVVYKFFVAAADGSLSPLGGGTTFGDLSVSFPYPQLTDTTTTFAVFIAVYNPDGSPLIKLRGKWTIKCVEETPPPPPPGDEGCTPGFWRQPQHFDSWTSPYTPGMDFSTVFEDAFPGMTLREVVRLGGGGLNALGRHTVAALLNAASPGVDYPLTTSQVISRFNAVYPGGNYEALKNVFEGYNESGCPLN
jgi:hypothetical protein